MAQAERLIESEAVQKRLHLTANQTAFAESLWQRYRPFAEFNSVARFHDLDRIQSVFWEMYLTCVLLQEGRTVIQLENPDGGRCGPDALVEHAGQRIWFEANAPECGRGADAVPRPLFDGKCRNIPDEEITLRYTNAIQNKACAFQDYVDDPHVDVHRNDAMVIAISSGSIPNAYAERELPRIVKAVLPFGNGIIYYDPQTHKMIGEGFQYRPDITKKSGASVMTTFFTDDRNSQISAVVFSYLSPWFLGDVQADNIGHDIIVVHNPHAAVPISRDLLGVGDAYHVEGNELIRRIMPKSRNQI